MSRPHPETISPTAHYTGYLWVAHGQSHDAFATRRGRWMYQLLRGPNAAAHALGLPTLDGMLLARHRLIDLRLAQSIEAGEVSQVIEVAAGLSPRGWRFSDRYGDRITYVEADLPDMVRCKRDVLARLGGETSQHRLVEVDALADEGPTSVAAVCATLDPSRGVALVTEGLLNYFDGAAVRAMWTRFARALARFPRALYLSDLVVQQGSRGLLVATFSTLLGAFVRGRVHVDFTGAPDVEAALDAAGFDGVVHDPRDFAFELPGLDVASAGVVRVIEAMPKG
jgi:O-methyltransferase involved in polyketide biosynthesis